MKDESVILLMALCAPRIRHTPIRGAFFLLALLALCAAHTPGYAQQAHRPVSLVDATGATVTLDRPPSRIVSLMPSNTEILFALGLGDAVVGVTDYCDYPPEAKRKPSIGNLMTFNVEKIVAMKPDLILATGDTPDEVRHGLSALGLRVFVLDPQTVSGILKALQTVGRLAGREAAADSLVRACRRRLDGVAAVIRAIPADRRPKVFVGDPNNTAQWTPGPATFTTDIITRAGGRNIADDLKPRTWGVYSLEQIVAKNPDLLLVVAAPDASPAAVRRHTLARARTLPGWRDISAVRDGRIAVIVSDFITRPGPRAILGVEQLAHQFYPGLF